MNDAFETMASGWRRLAVAVFAWGICHAAPAMAQTVTIATGDYAPFVAGNLPSGGVTAEIVSASFKAQGLTASYEYMPWRRGYEEARHGTYAGTFPYLRTADREALFLYSEPIISDRLRLFTRRQDLNNKDWAGKTLCVPNGYDVSAVQDFIVRNRLTLERPSEMSNCFKMLDAGRVALIWSSEAVADSIIKASFESGTPRFATLSYAMPSDENYFFIVSKSRPDASELMSRFNAGLQAIKSDGAYARILKRHLGRARGIE